MIDWDELPADGLVSVPPARPADRTEQAARMFAVDLADGRVPGIERIRKGMHVGQPRAQRIRAHLRTQVRSRLAAGPSAGGEPIMAKHEITVLAQTEPGGPMVMVDRCTVQAADAGEAARKYAALFVAMPTLIRPRERGEEAG